MSANATQQNKTILLVEDEDDIAALISFSLEQEKYQTVRASSGEEGMALARQRKPALVVLDLMLPGMDGLEVCKRLRSDPATSSIAVLMLTAKSEETDIVVGLELGADDYVVKPFSPKVLLAKIKALLRRREEPQADAEPVATFKEMSIHPGRREVLVAGKEVSLTRSEFGIIHLLASKPGWVFTRGQILDVTRGEDVQITERAVDVQVVSLRKKLGLAGAYIETVRGVGYRLKE
jgi:two-component system phosphate regulon response regulator PhoB